METWPPQHFEYLVNDPDDWKNRSSLHSNLYESKMFQCWCVRKIRSSIGIGCVSHARCISRYILQSEKRSDTQKKLS